MRYPSHILSQSLGIALGVILSTGFAFSQGNQPQIPPPQKILTAPAGTCAAFHVTAATLQDLPALPKTNDKTFGIKVLFGTTLYELKLDRFEVRSPDFKLIVDDGKKQQVVATPPCVTYRGEVVGQNGSFVAASLVGGQLWALVQLKQNDGLWGIQPVNEVNQTAAAQTHIVYHSTKNNAPAGKCGVVDLEEQHVPAPKTYAPQAAGNQLCEIAIDADNYLYQLYSSNVTSTQNAATTVVNGVAAIYKRDVAIDYKITTIVVRTSRVYSTTYLPSLLSQFRSYWNSYHTGIKRDTAHLFHGLGGGGILGVSYLGTICSTSGSYGVSKIGFSSNLTNRYALVAHELGHAWSSPHCDNYSPCNIMCSGFGGCSRNITTFSSFAKSYITNHRNSRTCLSAAGATLTAVTPNQVQAFPPGTITLTGSGLTNVNKINVGSQAVQSSQINIVSDTKLTFVAPVPNYLLPVAVNAEVSSQKSNSLPFYWQVTKPPQLVANSLAKPGGTMFWQYGADPANLWFLTVGLTSNTTGLLGYQWLNNAVLILSGTLDSAGISQQAVSIPSNVALGVKFYSQVVTLNPNSGTFAGNTNVTLTTTSK